MFWFDKNLKTSNVENDYKKYVFTSKNLPSNSYKFNFRVQLGDEKISRGFMVDKEETYNHIALYQQKNYFI